MNPSSDSFINVVQIDGLVLLKIIKHCRESLPDLVTGQLLGLDFYSTLEVTHSYPLPSRPVTDEDEQAEVEDSAAAEFQLDTMRLLRDVNVDTIPVGWYYSTYLGSFMTKSFVRDQFIFQEGIKKSVVLVFDPIKTNSGNLSLHAYRLTDRFMDKYRKEMSGDQFSLKDLSFEEIFEEVPIKIHNSNYVNVLLSELEEIPSMKCMVFNLKFYDSNSTSRQNLRKMCRLHVIFNFIIMLLCLPVSNHLLKIIKTKKIIHSIACR
eukprot:TRINITY_DN6819_c0_g3_i1.p1 TRINITY_DN6819_c0_g3~~TRINITY_DN6819_c0_g3_i1.p1  ORF type:complete len:263 (+),score=53.71 TRINITY_DN6819_c0_g3_i1:68-856(+)